MTTAAYDLGPAFKGISLDGASASCTHQNTVDESGTVDLLHDHTTYDSKDSAIKRTLHGTIYQMKILMLIVKSATSGTQQMKFRLATEMSPAHKFDDAVLLYSDPTDEHRAIWRFMQIKHVGRKITVGDLESTSEDNPFGLLKYFNSFYKINEDELFVGRSAGASNIREYHLRDFTIITNTDFDLTEQNKRTKGGQLTICSQNSNKCIRKWKSFLVEDETSDGDVALSINNSKQGKCVKIEPNAAARTHLFKIFKIPLAEIALKLKAIEDFPTIEKTLALITSNKRYDLNAKKLQEDKSELSKMEEKLKKAKEMIKSATTVQQMMVAIETLKLTEKLWHHPLDKLRRVLASKIATKISHLAMIRIASDHKVLHDYLEKFIDKFRFVVSFPDASELEALLATNLGQQYNLKNVDLINTDFEAEMVQFLKENNERHENRYYSERDANNFFAKVNQKLVSLMTTGLSMAFCEKLRKCCVSFTQDVREITEFLSNRNRQFLHLSTKFERIGSLQVYQTLNNTGDYKARDSHIFLPLDLLERSETRNQVKMAFGFNHNGPKGPHELLIVECPNIINDPHRFVDFLFEFSKIIVGNSSKKLILISDECNTISKYFDTKDELTDHYMRVIDETGFEHISKESQATLLGSVVNFQGDENKLLNELLTMDMANRNKIINRDTLSRLLDEKDVIVIGNQNYCSSIGYDQEMYFERTFFVKNETKTTFESEMGLLMRNDRLLIIASNAGTGKTTSLTSLAIKLKQIDPNQWIERINLLNFTDARKSVPCLEDIQFCHEASDAIEFVTKMVFKSNYPSNALQRNLFKVGLEHGSPDIVLLIDGFDEVCPNYQSKTVALLSALLKSKVKRLVITTRTHMKKQLEADLMRNAWELGPLSYSDQLLFLEKFLKWHMKHYHHPLSGALCDRTYNDILQTVEEICHKKYEKILAPSSTLFKDVCAILQTFSSEQCGNIEDLKCSLDKLNLKDFIEQIIGEWNVTVPNFLSGAPLHLKMLADVLICDNEKQLLSYQLKLADIYQAFIDGKFKIKAYEKENMERNPPAQVTYMLSTNVIRKIHRELAVKLLIPNYQCLNLPDLGQLNEFKHQLEEHYPDKDENEEVIRYGLMYFDGTSLQFIHRSLGEYFLHEYLITNVKNEVAIDLLSTILSRKEFLMNRLFFDNYLINLNVDQNATVIEHLSNGQH